VFLPHISKEYSVIPLILLGIAAGDSISFIGRVINVPTLAVTRVISLLFATYAVHVANLALYCSYLGHQLSANVLSPSNNALMALLIALTGCLVVVMTYVQYWILVGVFRVMDITQTSRLKDFLKLGFVLVIALAFVSVGVVASLVFIPFITQATPGDDWSTSNYYVMFQSLYCSMYLLDSLMMTMALGSFLWHIVSELGITIETFLTLSTFNYSGIRYVGLLVMKWFCFIAYMKVQTSTTEITSVFYIAQCT
jgi:hypothetical protein